MSQDHKPCDARLAYRLVYPLRHSWVRPNHLTTLRLLFGLLACIGLATGEYLYSNIGAFCFVVSNFLDHADGELARLTDRASHWGHCYDLAGDALIHILLFFSIGLGLRHSPLGVYAGIMGLIAGVAVAIIFHLRHRIEKKLGKNATRQSRLGGLETEDVLYCLPLVSLLDGQFYFLMLASIGAPCFACIVGCQALRCRAS